MSSYYRNFAAFVGLSIIVLAAFGACTAAGADPRIGIVTGTFLCGIAVGIERFMRSGLFSAMGLPAVVLYSGFAVAAASDLVGGTVASVGLIAAAALMVSGAFFVISRLSRARPPIL